MLVYDREQPKIWHPDFYLPNFAIYIEYYGGAGQRDYDRGIDRKTGVYAANGLDVIPIYPWTFLDEWQDYIVDSLEAITTRRMDLLPKGSYARRPMTQLAPREPPMADTYARQPRQVGYPPHRYAERVPGSSGRRGTYRL